MDEHVVNEIRVGRDFSPASIGVHHSDVNSDVNLAVDPRRRLEGLGRIVVRVLADCEHRIPDGAIQRVFEYEVFQCSVVPRLGEEGQREIKLLTLTSRGRFRVEERRNGES